MGKHSRQELTPSSPREELNQAYDRREDALDALNHDFDGAVLGFDAADDPKFGLRGLEYIHNKMDAALKAFDEDFAAFAKLDISINVPGNTLSEISDTDVVMDSAEVSPTTSGVSTNDTQTKGRSYTNTGHDLSVDAVNNDEIQEGFSHPEVVKYVDGTAAYVFRTEGDKITWGDECVWADMSDSQNIAIVRTADDAIILNQGVAITSTGEAYEVGVIPELTIGSSWKLKDAPIDIDKVEAVILEGTHHTDDSGRVLDHASPLFSYAKEQVAQLAERSTGIVTNDRNRLKNRRRPSYVGSVALQRIGWLRAKNEPHTRG